eukprot:255288_1
MGDISDPNAFLQLERGAFVTVIHKHIKTVSRGFALKFRFALKRKAKSQGIDPQNIGHDVFHQLIVDSLRMMQTTSVSLQEALHRNDNDIARVQTLLDAGRKGFATIIQNKGNASLVRSHALHLYDTILYSLKQKAQTRQFGEFLSEVDMDVITKDYHHILKVHVREGDKACIENCFRYFAYAVHFEDKSTETKECRSVKRNQVRTDHLTTEQPKTDPSKKGNNHIDIWTSRQHYVQSQLDIIHSYLVH